jgi:hypothetical protein
MESARTAMGGGMQAAAEYAPPLAPAPTAGASAPAPTGAPGAVRRAVVHAAAGDAATEFLSQGPDGQRQVLVQLLRAGESDASIGARFRLSQWQVRNLRYRLGIRKDRGGNVHIAPRGGRGPAVEAAPSVALELAGLFEAADLARRLLALGAMFEAAPGTYRVRLQIEQPGA